VRKNLSFAQSSASSFAVKPSFNRSTLLLGLAEILVIPPSWEFILAEKTKFKAISAYLGFVLASDMSVREDDGTFVGDFTCSTAWKIELEYVCERVSIWRKEEVAINRSNHPCKSLL
jgi:hypothetical protein